MKIVQIGSNRGSDSLTKYLEANGIMLDFGLFVEANALHIPALQKCYPNYVVENIAIKPSNSDKQELTLYYHDRDGNHHEIASVNPDHVLRHIPNSMLCELKSFTVPCLSLEQLLDKHGITKLDWLLIDVEGLDADIALNFNWSKYDIKRIDIEHLHLGDKKDEVFDLFKRNGYSVNAGLCERGYDTAFVKDNVAVKDHSGDVNKMVNTGNVKVYDCFPFFNEFDILEMRLNITAPYVDRWVISESNKTHSGLDKPFYLREALNASSRFDRFKDRIDIVNYGHLGGNNWDTENLGRDCIGDYVKKIADPNDWIVSSDCDEIPNLSMANFDIHDKQRFYMHFFYYFLNCDTGYRWNDGNMFRVRDLDRATMTQHRKVKDGLRLEGAGWHWSYCGGAEKIRQKLQSYAHQEYNTPQFTNLERIEKIINAGEDVLGRGWKLKFVLMDDRFPKYLLDNLEKYKHLIHQLS